MPCTVESRLLFRFKFTANNRLIVAENPLDSLVTGNYIRSNINILLWCRHRLVHARSLASRALHHRLDNVVVRPLNSVIVSAHLPQVIRCGQIQVNPVGFQQRQIQDAILGTANSSHPFSMTGDSPSLVSTVVLEDVITSNCFSILPTFLLHAPVVTRRMGRRRNTHRAYVSVLGVPVSYTYSTA